MKHRAVTIVSIGTKGPYGPGEEIPEDAFPPAIFRDLVEAGSVEAIHETKEAMAAKTGDAPPKRVRNRSKATATVTAIEPAAPASTEPGPAPATETAPEGPQTDDGADDSRS